MRNILAKIIGFSALLISLNASATLLKFDDIREVGPFSPIGVYNGFSFSNLYTVDLSTNYPYYGAGPAKSGSFAVVNRNFADDVITAFSGPTGSTFSLTDVYFKSWSSVNIGKSVSLEGILKGQLVGSVDFVLGSSWTDIVANFNEIDKLVIHVPNQAEFMFDNMTLGAAIHTQPPVDPPIGQNPVPEPGVLALLSLGLLAVGAASKRRAS